MALATMRELLEAGIHFGHQTRRWNPKMQRYIYGARNGIYIIDLQKTMRQLRKAYELTRQTVSQGGTVLFVGTKKQAADLVQQEAERCGMFYVNSRWLGGTLTNFETIQKSIRNLLHMENMMADGTMEKRPKKEQIKMREQIERLNKNLGGIKTMDKLPSLIFVVDTKKEHIAVREAERLEIPCIGITDTNADPDAVSLPVPGNDDAIRAVSLFCRCMADAVIEGRATAQAPVDAPEPKFDMPVGDEQIPTQSPSEEKVLEAAPESTAQPEGVAVAKPEGEATEETE